MGSRPVVLPCAIENFGWQDVVTTPATADNSGNLVLQPAGLSATTHPKFYPEERGTIVQLRIKYARTATPNNSPLLNLFGYVGESGSEVPMTIYDPDTGSRDFTLAPDGTNDVDDGSAWKYSKHVEVDAQGAKYLIVAIKTAFTVSAGATTGATIQARMK